MCRPENETPLKSSGTFGFRIFIRYLTFALIPLSILGPAVMMPKVGPIHLLPHWLLLSISLPVGLLILLKNNFVLRFPLDIKRDLHITMYIAFLLLWVFYSFASSVWTGDQLLGAIRSSVF